MSVAYTNEMKKIIADLDAFESGAKDRRARKSPENPFSMYSQSTRYLLYKAGYSSGAEKFTHLSTPMLV